MANAHALTRWAVRSAYNPGPPTSGTTVEDEFKEKLSGCSNMTIWRLRRDGKLPKPKKLGNRNVTLEGLCRMPPRCRPSAS